MVGLYLRTCVNASRGVQPCFTQVVVCAGMSSSLKHPPSGRGNSPGAKSQKLDECFCRVVCKAIWDLSKVMQMGS